MKQSIVAIIILALLGGCATIEATKILPNDPDFAPILPETEDESMVATGSLFKANYINNM